MNSRLNDMDLMKSALKLLPKNKNQCYPRDKTDVDYFKQITAYFKQEMKLRNTEMYCDRLKNRPPLMMSLALQMKFKAAICRRDYVLIYITLLRAIGIQCRMVQSVVADPKICPKTELISLSKKKEPAPAKKVVKSSTNKKKSTKEKIKIPQLDGGDDIEPSKRKTRSSKNKITPKKLSSILEKETFSPKVKVSVDSPNRITKAAKSSDKVTKNGTEKVSEEAKKNRALEMTKKATLNVFSPRKTRSMSRDQSPKPSTSTQPPKSQSDTKSKKNDPKKKDTLKIVLPRTTRSRSRSQEPNKSDTKPNKSDTKPNLNKLATKRKNEDKTEASASKVPKLAEKTSRKRESSSKDEKVDKKKPRVAKVSESSEDGSLKYFKLNKSVKVESKSSASTSKVESKSSASTSKVCRKVISPDKSPFSADEEFQSAFSPRKSKGIDIWVEAYSEKEEKWISIDVHRGKVDCAQDIAKKATQPLVYVFAWNNDNSIKDVSARYCKDLNTRIRKMRVDREYLNSVLHLFAGIRTTRDFKEDDELNKLQVQEGMPKSIAE